MLCNRRSLTIGKKAGQEKLNEQDLKRSIETVYGRTFQNFCSEKACLVAISSPSGFLPVKFLSRIP